MSKRVRTRLLVWGILIGYVAIYLVARQSIADVSFDPSLNGFVPNSQSLVVAPERSVIWSGDEQTSFESAFNYGANRFEQARLRISEALFWPLTQLELWLFAYRIQFAP